MPGAVKPGRDGRTLAAGEHRTEVCSSNAPTDMVPDALFPTAVETISLARLDGI